MFKIYKFLYFRRFSVATVSRERQMSLAGDPIPAAGPFSMNPGVNFINILRALFCRYFGTKKFQTQNTAL